MKKIITLVVILLSIFYAQASTDIYIVGTMNDWKISSNYKMTETVEDSEWTFDFGQTKLAGQHFLIKSSAMIGIYLGACNTAGTLAEGIVTLQGNGYDIQLSPKYKSATNVKLKLTINGAVRYLTVSGDFIEDESYVPVSPVSATEPSGTLPVLYITSSTPKSEIDESATHDVATTGTCYINSNDITGIENLGDKDNPYPITIQGRGNYTWKGFDKNLIN